MSELTISKVNRQFRTLRAKCTALNSLVLAAPKPTVTITYGRQTRSRKPQDNDDVPPLAILQSLDRFGARLHLDRAIVENMQLSKRIYEVRDAFSHIIQSVFGDPTGGDDVPPHILSLTGICARIVGEQAPSEADAAVDDDPNSEGHEDEIRSRTIEELYENVPPQHRHFTFVAHALTYILDTCPHHPTLLNALLEVCLSHRLIPEVHTVLLALFTVAIVPRPHSTSPCPLTHPAHKNFLTSLREMCTRLGPSYSVSKIHENFVINDQTFTRILVDALSQPHPEQMHAWTSKAVTRLARDLREHDFSGCFVPLCTGLVHAVSQATYATKKPPSKHAKTLEEMSYPLRTNAFERLAKWINSMLDTLHQRTPPPSDGAEFGACIDFLAHLEPLRLHISSDPAASPTTCLADSLCCLAAYCLASVPTPAVPATDPDLPALESLLRAASIRNTTFDGLVSHVFPLPSFAIFRAPLSYPSGDTPTPPPPALPSNAADGGGAQAIDALAGPLRARGLLQCEVSLYLCALQHVEELIAAPAQMSSPSKRRSEKELFGLRMELMDRVEDAERRCYGGPGARAQNAGTDGAHNGEQEWVWEDLVGSWVVKSPAVVKAKTMMEKQREKDLARASKRRKLDGTRATGARAGAPNARASSTSLAGNASTLTSTTSTSKRKALSAGPSRVVSRAPSPSSYDKENYVSDHDPEGSSDTNTDTDTEAGEPTPAPTHTRNFATILADSQRNVVSLRAEREAAAQAKLKPNRSAPKPKPNPKGRASAPGPARAPSSFFAIPESPASASVSVPRPAPWTQVPVPRRRTSNFASMVEDSHRNVVSLREERAREAAAAASQRKAFATPLAKRKRPFCTPGRASSASSDEEAEGQEERERRREEEKEAHVELDSSPVRPAYVEPSSDDALNLFAYPDSSPVKGRRRMF